MQFLFINCINNHTFLNYFVAFFVVIGIAIAIIVAGVIVLLVILLSPENFCDSKYCNLENNK